MSELRLAYRLVTLPFFMAIVALSVVWKCVETAWALSAEAAARVDDAEKD